MLRPRLASQPASSSPIWNQLLLRGWPLDHRITVCQPPDARIVPKLRTQSKAGLLASSKKVGHQMLSPDCVPILPPLAWAPGHNLLHGLLATVPGTVLGTSHILTNLLLPTSPILQVKKLKLQEINSFVEDHALGRQEARAGLHCGHVCLQGHHAHKCYAPWPP